jgi:hypothetical protein
MRSNFKLESSVGDPVGFALDPNPTSEDRPDQDPVQIRSGPKLDPDPF